MLEEIKFSELNENLAITLKNDWALVTAGNDEKYNTMTVSWGAFGELWGEDTATVYIRPQRYTKKFLDEQEYFTLSFFDEKYKDALRLCGRVSGRDCDKAAKAGLSVASDGEAVYPAEARLVIKCKKIAVQSLDNSGFIDTTIEENYKNSDYHYIYVGEIEKVIEKN